MDDPSKVDELSLNTVHIDLRPSTLFSTRHNGYFSIIRSCRISIRYFHNNDNQQNIPPIICILLHDNFWTDFNCSKFAHCPVSRRRIYMDEGVLLELPGSPNQDTVLTNLNLVHYLGIEQFRKARCMHGLDHGLCLCWRNLSNAMEKYWFWSCIWSR